MKKSDSSNSNRSDSRAGSVFLFVKFGVNKKYKINSPIWVQLWKVKPLVAVSSERQNFGTKQLADEVIQVDGGKSNGGWVGEEVVNDVNQ